MPLLSLKRILWGLAALLLGATALGYYHWYQASRLPAGVLQVNGRIEGDTAIAASKRAGRAVEIVAREGDTVSAGQALVRLDDETARARAAAARAALDAARARAAAARAALDVLCQQVPYAIAAAQAAVEAAEAALRKARAGEQQARRDRERYQTLAGAGAADRELAEQALSAWHQAAAEADAAAARLTQARQALRDARLGPDRIRAKQTDVAALEAEARAAAAGHAEAQAALADLTIVAPATATVTEKLVELGEVVTAGAPLFELVDLDALYLRAFVAELEIGKVRRGLPARVYVDAFPEQAFDAEVRYIASRAEFTPKQVQTPDERVKLVYAVKLYLAHNPDHRLTPGLPADAVIRWRQDAPWAGPAW